ncbi:MAG: tRNA uridine-5-carboxymethylaminomethyl(34) synthesis GTPase MnmE, partial [Clostridia bacterium]|nr:tRNA uridine-5-carboxymethylaminomethyl(34) synthesis GTPase MnmE [Clostridia bacterium]
MTIAAIATPNMTGGIGIIRISGEKAVEIASGLFYGKDVKTMESHKMHLGKIKVNNETVDNALVCVFKAPNSYTGEDVVEFHCHGGIAVCKTVLDAVY